MLMRNITEIPPSQDIRPITLRHLRVAAYCRVSTELEEQTSSIELQERHYSQLISANPNWESAGIFAERATGLNTKERPEFRRMIAQCRKKRIDLPDKVYQPLWAQYAGYAAFAAGSAWLGCRSLF